MSRDKPVLTELLFNMRDRLLRDGVAGLIFKEVCDVEGSIYEEIMITIGHERANALKETRGIRYYQESGLPLLENGTAA